VRLGFEGDAEGGGVAVVVVGLVFWASDSGMLTLDFVSDWEAKAASCCPVNLGGRVSLTSGIPPAMDVSGIPVFRGGGVVSRVCGRWAVAVWSWRLDDKVVALEDEKFLNRCGH